MPQTDSFLATGFRDVDDNQDTAKLSACLRFMEGLPSFATYKARSLERMHLKPGDVAVDIGCGLGFDVARIAERVLPGGLAVGVDSSSRLLDEANRVFHQTNRIEFRQGDVHKLDFGSATVDSIRADRMLQHVENPRKAISEMARVLKPGGWLVCAEPDWRTFVVDSDDLDTFDLVAGRWRDSFMNPVIGRQLHGLIRSEGLQNTWVEGFVLLASGLDAVNTVYDVAKTVQLLKNEDQNAQERYAGWFRALEERDELSGVVASVTLFAAGGQKAF